MATIGVSAQGNRVSFTSRVTCRSTCAARRNRAQVSVCGVDVSAELPGSPVGGSDETPDNARWPIAVTTAAWLIAGLVLLALGSRVPADQRWWIAVCAV